MSILQPSEITKMETCTQLAYMIVHTFSMDGYGSMVGINELSMPFSWAYGEDRGDCVVEVWGGNAKLNEKALQDLTQLAVVHSYTSWTFEHRQLLAQKLYDEWLDEALGSVDIEWVFLIARLRK